MALTIYNTLSREKEVFTPIAPPRVAMYVCGPTVYSDSHIGHAKSYVTFDVVRRYLKFLGYNVTFVENITDVGHLTDDADEGEDKLAKKGAEVKQHPMQIAETYTRNFYEDMAAMNVLPPDIAPRATGHIIEQIEMIRDLVQKGFAYEVGGSVYFDVTKDPDYGKLSGRKTEDQEAQGRVESRSEKRNPQDFALWKKAEKGHILHWPSPWGEGFPGWHIECSAMSMKYLGQTLDIHGGGIENQFPHHECEIAQSESSTGKQFVRYWMHNNMVTVDGKKMGKSLGNSSYLRDLFKEFDPMTLRYFLLGSHYRSTTEFKIDAIQAAGTGYEKLLATVDRLRQAVNVNGTNELTGSDKANPIFVQFTEDMNDDFNTPKAIATLFDLSRETNDALTSGADAPKLLSYARLWNALAGEILGILPTRNPVLGTRNSDSALDTVMQTVIGWRNEARAAKDFKMSDSIRDDLAKAGVILEDGKDGTKWSVK
jgi:cysteinyl-tRNA synthetase